MTTLQAVFVILLALLFSVYVIRSAKVARLDMRHTITWLVVTAGILLVAIFPRGVFWLAGIIGFEASTNMLFIAAIAILAVIVFRQTMLISAMEKKMTRLTQTVALIEHDMKGHMENEIEKTDMA